MVPGEKNEVVSASNFEKWLDRLEHDQDTQNTQIGELRESVVDLKGVVGGLAASVQTLVDNQRGLFSRANRPVPWAAIIGGFTMLVVMSGLLILPLQKEQDRLWEANKMAVEHREYDAGIMGGMQKDIEWLKKMEDRLYEQSHRRE